MTGEKASTKKKRFKLSDIKKPVIISGITSIIAIAGIIVGMNIIISTESGKERILFCCFDDVPNSLDPLSELYFRDLIVIAQVAEGLFDINQSNKNAPIINNLATEGVWSEDYLNFTCTLKSGIRFHDGTPFNATAVKWNFDRLQWFLDNKPWWETWGYLYAFVNNEGQWHINRTEVLDTYVIRFVLNKRYIPFKALLTIPQLYILSPTSTPENDYINISAQKIVGTGPFKQELCHTYWGDFDTGVCINTTLTVNPDYWGKRPKFDKIFYSWSLDEERLNDMLSHKLSFVQEPNLSNVEIYKNTPDITVVNRTQSGYSSIPMNNELINKTMRKAISYAFNYTYYFDVFHEGAEHERIKSVLPKWMLYSNWKDFEVPFYNITVARQTLLDVNWNGTFGLTADEDTSPGNPWEMIANSSNPLATYKYSYPLGSWVRGNFSLEIARNLKQIGVKVEDDPLTWPDWWTKMFSGELEIFLVGWNAIFNDPVEIINPLFSTKADGLHNFYHFNDTEIQQWMDAAVEESNSTARGELYYQIQERLIEQLYPVIWLSASTVYFAHASNVRGIPQEGHAFRILFKEGFFV
ncbi:MAG: ABC transporter substrate-binding protein [Candidatus Hermodarchaeota archaeon]